MEIVMVTSNTGAPDRTSVYLFSSKDFADSFANDLEAKYEACGCSDIFKVRRETAEVIR